MTACHQELQPDGAAEAPSTLWRQSGAFQSQWHAAPFLTALTHDQAHLPYLLERGHNSHNMRPSAWGSRTHPDAAWVRAQEAADMVDQAQQEKEEAEQEAEKARRQMELDVDEEIEQLKSKCALLAMVFLLNSSDLPCIPVSSLVRAAEHKIVHVVCLWVWIMACKAESRASKSKVCIGVEVRLHRWCALLERALLRKLHAVQL